MTYVKERPSTPEKEMEGMVQSADELNAAAVAASRLSEEQSEEPRDTTVSAPQPDLEALTVRCPIHQLLRFYPNDSESVDSPPLSLMVLDAALVPDDRMLLDCRLTLQVPFSVYQDILNHHWFNLIPAILHPGHDEAFNPDQDVVIDIGLKPDCLEPLTTLLLESSVDLPNDSLSDPFTDGNINPESIIQGLITLNEDEDSFLFQIDQWLCCSVKQQLDEDEVGYTTLWSYLLIHPLVANKSDPSIDESVVEAFTDLFKDAAVTFQSEFEKQLPQLQSNWLEFLDGLKEIVDEVVDELKTDGKEEGLGTNIDSNVEERDDEAVAISLMDRVVKPFFDSEDWSFVQLDGTTLQLAFQGGNGRWTCFAEINDDTEQFIFYSFYPLQVNLADCSSMLEFLMRANSGLIIGNFELDFTAGELRFKTSVDVEGIQSKLSSCHSVYQQLWRQLVYINVITMDRYFPGITAIVNQTLTPEEAIALVEQ